MLAGSVYVQIVDDVLTVVGDRECNVFTVDLTAETSDRLVRGQDNTRVRLATGLDSGFDLQRLKDVCIYANNGDDVVTIYAEGFDLDNDLVVSLAHGDDALYIFGGTVHQDLTIFGGANHDSVFVSDVAVGGDFYFAGNAGTDVMILNSIDVAGRTLGRTQLGHDKVLVNASNFNKAVYFEMGDGADRF
jgi:hypothetical protein